MNLLLARIAPARILSDDDKHRLTVDPSECKWVTVSDTPEGWGFLRSAWNLGYAIINLGPVAPGWGGVGPEGWDYNFGYTVPFWEDVPQVA